MTIIAKGISEQFGHLIVALLPVAISYGRVLLEQHPPPARVEELLRPRDHAGVVCAGACCSMRASRAATALVV